MKSRTAKRILSTLSGAAIPVLFTLAVISVPPRVARAQDESLGTSAKGKIELTTTPSPTPNGISTMQRAILSNLRTVAARLQPIRTIP
jgi:hypothetical protein